ncbi:bifunctional FO biosynthesis protein CofGH [soil metagenome]
MISAARHPDTSGALDRASGGAQLSVDDAEVLLQARGDDLDALLDLAGALRDEGLESAGRPGVITYSRKVFLPITNLCRDRCHYCVFVQSPAQLARQGKSLYMSPEQILRVARQGAAMGCKEALFTLGDRPEERWPEARAWLDDRGYATTIDYVAAMARLVLQETGLLPHMNPGVMTAQELASLRPCAPSMGMMLETTATRLWSEKGQVHFGSPDKDPAVRLKVLEDAGEAKVPLTTGILVGIGEDYRERAESLIALRASHARHHQLQEVIVQNFRAKPSTAMRTVADLAMTDHLAAIAVARLVLGPDMRIQVPPNLSDVEELRLLLRAGADDWGGVSPLTADHVNPERPWPQLDELAARTAEAGFTLRERLTAHPEYIDEEWIDPALLPRVLELAEPGTRLAVEGRRPVGHGSRAILPGSRSALSRAADDPSGLSDADYVELLSSTGDNLDALAALASDLRRYTVGEAISLVANRNLATNRLGAELPDLDAVGLIAADAWELGATELCVQGVLPAGADYLEVVRRVKAAAPGIHLHAFRPADLADGAARAGLSDTEFLIALREAGVDSVTGTGVKILDEDVRHRLAPDDLPIPRWLELIRAAHGLDIHSTSVMVYGLGETMADRVAHLRLLARLQEETGGVSEFVPMPALGTSISTDEHRAVHAVSRLILHGRISHIQVPWTRLDAAQVKWMLRSGADDLGGTLFDGRVLPEAGAEHGRELSLDAAARIAHSLSRPLRQRTTAYGEPSDERKAAARG